MLFVLPRMTKKHALQRIIHLIEYWVDNPEVRHEDVLWKILDTALAALPET